MPTTPFHSDDANDANGISCITTPQQSPPTQPQKTFPRCTLLPQHAPGLRVPFAGHPPDPLTTHFVRQTQLRWRLLRRLVFVIKNIYIHTNEDVGITSWPVMGTKQCVYSDPDRFCLDHYGNLNTSHSDQVGPWSDWSPGRNARTHPPALLAQHLPADWTWKLVDAPSVPARGKSRRCSWPAPRSQRPPRRVRRSGSW